MFQSEHFFEGGGGGGGGGRNRYFPSFLHMILPVDAIINNLHKMPQTNIDAILLSYDRVKFE